MNARNLLIGIGIVAVVTGGVLGSGALTQVNAERTATVSTAGDGSAAIGLSPASGIDSKINGTSINSNGVLTIGFDNVNKNANTTTAAFDVTNNLNEAVGLQVGSSADWLTIENVNDSSSTWVNLPSTQTKTVRVTINTTTGSGYSSTSNSADITVIANTTKSA